MSGFLNFSVTVDPRALEAQVARVGRLPEVIYDAMERAKERIESPFKAELEYTPPPAKKPIQWTSEKQRKAYFATDGFGAGIPYKRTGRLQNSWRFFIAKTPDGGKFTVFNTSPVGKFVFGTIAKSDDKAYDAIQQFHTNTGWQKAKPTVVFWFDAYLEVLNDEFKRGLNAFAR